METPSTFIAKAVAAIGLATLIAPPFGASADTTVQNQNTSESATAVSGPALAFTDTIVVAGPSADGTDGPAMASQIGDNVVDSPQESTARSGDATAGSQVVVAGDAGSGDTEVQNQNETTSPVAVTSEADAAAGATVAAGPVAEGGTSDALATQNGTNEAIVSQDVEAESGNSAAGSQFHTTGAQLAAPTDTPAPQIAWLAFALVGTYMLLMVTRRSPSPAGAGARPTLLDDAGLGATLRLPGGWTTNRSVDGVVAFYDPDTSTDGSIAEAELGVLCQTKDGSMDAASRAADRLAADPTYRHLDSGFVSVRGARAWRHAYEVRVAERDVHVVEHFVPQRADAKVLRVTAYATSGRELPGIEDVLERVSDRSTLGADRR